LMKFMTRSPCAHSLSEFRIRHHAELQDKRIHTAQIL